MNLCTLAILSAAAGGCVLPADEPEAESSVQELGGQCPTWKCGENSPQIDNYGFHELNLDHIPNGEGFSLGKFTKGTTEYTLNVQNGNIFGIDVNGQVLGGQALIGAIIQVKHAAGTYDVKITDVQATWFWAKTPQGTYPQFQSYKFQWLDLIGKWHDLCPLTPDPDDTLGLDGHHTLVFEGDRIDAKTKVIYDKDERWFNIGCAGSTLAKMHLTGHSYPSAAYGFATTTAERQTMLKMLSADYCGDGTPFTVAGMPLYWGDDHSWMKVPGQANLEARWSSKGATCLMMPRVAVNPTKLASETFPDIYGAIKAECMLPPKCQDSSLNVGPEHLLSANPVLP